MKIAVIVLSVAVVPFIAACDLQDLINPGAASREAYQHRQSLLIQPDTPKPIVVPVKVEPTKPACYAIFRVRACSETGEEIWL